MNNANNSDIMKRVVTRSGLNGWQAKLQHVYANYEEFCNYDSIYNIASRLGFSSCEIAWSTNPTVFGSVNPSDLGTNP